MEYIKSIIKDNGEPNLGIYDIYPIDFNYKNFKLKNFFDNEIKGLAKKYKYHNFNFISVLNDDITVGLAIIDLGYLKSGFAYIIDNKNQKLVLDKRVISVLTSSPSDNPDNYVFDLNSNGLRITIEKNYKEKELKAMFNYKDVSFFVKAYYNYDEYKPLRVLTPAEYNGWTFTEKLCKYGIIKEMFIESKNFNYKSKNDENLIYDWTAGYLKRLTTWNWIAFSSKEFSANFSSYVNETYYSENVYWYKNQRYLVERIIFEYDSEDLTKEWKIYDKDKKLELYFKPFIERNEKVNALFVKSYFRQFVGNVRGYLIDNENNKFEFNNIKSIAEIHRALW